MSWREKFPRLALVVSTAVIVSLVWAIVSMQMVLLGMHIAQEECREVDR
jgi:hypothetical protein